MTETIKIELSRTEFDLLLLALGLAAGTVKDHKLFNNLLRLANAVNKNNPAWTPYEVPK